MRVIEYKEDGSYIDELRKAVMDNEYAIVLIEPEKNFIITTEDFPADWKEKSNEDLEAYLGKSATDRYYKLLALSRGLSDRKGVMNQIYGNEYGSSVKK